MKALLPLKTNAPDRDPASMEVLVVGCPPWNLQLARSIASNGSRQEMETRRVSTAEELPLKQDPTRGAVDLLVFTLSMTSRLSFDRVRESVKAVGQEQVNLIGGRWVLVVMDASTPSGFAFALEEVMQFGQRMQLPIMFCESTIEESVTGCAARVIAMLRHAARSNSISPLLSFTGTSSSRRM